MRRVGMVHPQWLSDGGACNGIAESVRGDAALRGGLPGTIDGGCAP